MDVVWLRVTGGTIFSNIIHYTDDKYRGDNIFKCTWIINTGETIS